MRHAYNTMATMRPRCRVALPKLAALMFTVAAFGLSVGGCASDESQSPGTSSNKRVAVTASSITLTWDDNASNEDGFVIQRKTADGTYAEVARVGANVTTYADSGLTSCTTFCYRVSAFNAVASSDFTNEVCETTLSAQ